MKVLITGNIGSGKSRLARAVLRAKPGLVYHAIDNFRRQHGDGSMEQETVARSAFLKAIQAEAPMLIECMGLGDLGLEVREVLEYQPYVVIRLEVPLAVCLDRLSQRVWEVPYPGTPESASSLCIQSHAEYEAGKIEARFSQHARGGVHPFPHTTPQHTSFLLSTIQPFFNDETT